MGHLLLCRVFLLLQVCSLAIIGTKADTFNCTTEMDLTLVVDSSGSICNDMGGPCPAWYSLLRFIRALVGNLTSGENNVRVAMIEFETSAVIKWNLTKYTNKTALLKAIDELPFIGGNTNTVAALDLLSTVFTPEGGDRHNVGNTAILITDGKPRRGSDPIPIGEIRDAVKRVLSRDIRLLVVGVTENIDMDTLKELSSPPNQVNVTVFVANDYERIEKVLNGLLNQTCTNITEQGPSTPTAELCIELLDICLVVDASGSICDSYPGFDYTVDQTCGYWIDNVNFIYAFVDGFDIGEQATRIALVIFSTDSVVKWNLGTYTNKHELLDAIRNLEYHKGGTTDMTGGINLMRTQVFGLSSDRSDAPNIAVVMTDGYPTMPSTLEPEIRAMRNSGIRSLVVGITDKVDMYYIKELASQPPKEGENYFLAKNYPNLEESVRSQLSAKVCLTPTVELASTTTTTNTLTSTTTVTPPASAIGITPTPNTGAPLSLPGSVSSPTTTTPTITTSTITTNAILSTTTVTPPASAVDITASPNTGAPVCSDAALDLCLLVDASGSICDNDKDFDYGRDFTCNNWRLIVEFLHKLVQGIFDSQLTRIGLVLFSTKAEIAFDLTKYTDKDELLRAVDSLTYAKGGRTDMTGALRLARTQVFNTAGDRPGFPNTEVMLTDGYPTDPSTLQAEIDATQQGNIRVLALGVTKDVDETTLQRVSSAPHKINETYFMALDYVDIESFRKMLQERICRKAP